MVVPEPATGLGEQMRGRVPAARHRDEVASKGRLHAVGLANGQVADGAWTSGRHDPGAEVEFHPLALPELPFNRVYVASFVDD